MVFMVKLTCNACGGKLEITDDIERFACGHCGNEWIVNRSGGIVSLKAIEEQLSKVQEHTKETAEHSKILADQVRLKAIKEKITTLSIETNGIDKNPQKKNNIKYANPLKIGWIALLVFIISLCIRLLLDKLKIKNIFVDYILGLPTMLSLSIICLCIVGAIINSIYSSLGNNTCSDEQQKQININKIKELKNEINNLENKAKEIEAGFFK